MKFFLIYIQFQCFVYIEVYGFQVEQVLVFGMDQFNLCLIECGVGGCEFQGVDGVQVKLFLGVVKSYFCSVYRVLSGFVIVERCLGVCDGLLYICFQQLVLLYVVYFGIQFVDLGLFFIDLVGMFVVNWDIQIEFYDLAKVLVDLVCVGDLFIVNWYL